LGGSSGFPRLMAAHLPAGLREPSDRSPASASRRGASSISFAGALVGPAPLHARPGQNEPCHIPNCVPFVLADGATGAFALDRSRVGQSDTRVVDEIDPKYRPMVLPTADQLSDAQYFIVRGLRT